MLQSSESIYDLDHVINMDETFVPRDAPSNHTLELKGSKKVVVNTTGKEKEHYTVILTVTYTGKRLYSIIIIKGKGVKKVKCTVPHDFHINYNKKSWINSRIMNNWVDDIFAIHVKTFQKEKKDYY